MSNKIKRTPPKQKLFFSVYEDHQLSNNTNNKTPKSSLRANKQNFQLIYNTSIKILDQQTVEEINKWLITSKISSHMLKNQKMKTVINLSLNILKQMIVEGDKKEKSFINKLIEHFNQNKNKIYQFCKCLKYYSFKDFQFEYIVDVALDRNKEPISFYIRCHNTEIQSYLNSNKKETMGFILGSEQEWFKIMRKIFTSMNIKESSQQQELIELFISIVKERHSQIKRTTSQQFNGSQIFRICQICYQHFCGQSKIIASGNSFHQQKISNRKEPKHAINEKKIERIFDKNIINELDQQDRELIRALSFRDQNIAKLLDKKHNKMIELIANEVEEMRINIQQEKQKYLELCREKDQIIKNSQSINQKVLKYILDDSASNQQKLLNSMQDFSVKYCGKRNLSTIEAIKAQKERIRLIEIIEQQQRQKC